MSDSTNIQDAIDAGIELAEPSELGNDGRFFTQVVPEGAEVQVHDLEELRLGLAEHPNRKKGTVHVQNAESFILYTAKHQLEATEVYADGARSQLVGVINAHSESDDQADEGTAGHGDHLVQLELVKSPEWETWVGSDKKWMVQIDFAHFLEDNSVNVITSPGADAATMLEIAESFYASQSADFKRSERLDNGVISLRYEETLAARAGEAGDIEIPKEFRLALPPFVGSDPVEVTARFRYRIREGNLALSYALLNVDMIARQAFLDIVEQVSDSITPPVFLGRP